MPLPRPSFPSFPLAVAAGVAAALLGAGLCLLPAHAQVPAKPAPAASAPASAPASKPTGGRAAPAKASAVKQQTKPLWTELTGEQRQALTPLAASWNTLNEAQKRKWLALSVNYPKMSGAEQAKLHSRMSEWVGLSPQQRVQARLSFGETKQISPDDKKAKWEAYQALSPEEKHKLAAKAAKPPNTAAAVKPVAPNKLANVPQGGQDKARIAASPNQVDHNTLLPQQGASPVSAPN